MDYPVTITPDDNDTFLVTFPDVPGAITYGDTIEEALARAPFALSSILETHIKDHNPIPRPSARRTKYRVPVPALVEAKIHLYEAMRTKKVTKAELGRRLQWHGPQVDRLLSMSHGSQVDQLEMAFGALGKRLVFSVKNATVLVHGVIDPTARAVKPAGARRTRRHGSRTSSASSRRA